MKKTYFLWGILLICIIVMTGCNESKNFSDEKEKNTIDSNIKGSESKNGYKQKENGTDSADNDKGINKEAYISQYAEANYFNKEYALVESFVYYNNGKNYDIKLDSKEGKKVYELLKKRFLNQGEYVTKDVSLKEKIADIKTKGKALEVKFNKEYLYATEAHENTDYKSIAIYLESWFYPLDGECEAYFTYIPKSEYTLGKLTDADELVEYLDSLY